VSFPLERTRCCPRPLGRLLLAGTFSFAKVAAACLRVSFDALLFFGTANFTPARRALDRPIAIACLAERAPCLPSRICSISSRTNSPRLGAGRFAFGLVFGCSFQGLFFRHHGSFRYFPWFASDDNLTIAICNNYCLTPAV